MSRTWVLRTETKGTGAQMVPLESATEESSSVEPVFVLRKPARVAEPEKTAPRGPWRFKVVDVMTRQTLAEDASAREVVDVLRGARSIVDVNVYVWQEERARWRLLTFDERRALWELRDANGDGPAARRRS